MLEYYLGKGAAGSGVLTGNDNVFLGTCVGLSITSGGKNVFLGQCAGNTNTTGPAILLLVMM